jgi:uncharacterized protein (DUF488 family)
VLTGGHAIEHTHHLHGRPFESSDRKIPTLAEGQLHHCATLAANGIAYVFVGAELGARPDDPSCYDGGRVQYQRLAATPLFIQGIDRVLVGAEKFRVALMCAEKEPLDCHRTLLVSRALERRHVAIAHILADGSIEHQPQTMTRLIDMVGLGGDDMFTDAAALAEEACRLRECKIAYVLAPTLKKVRANSTMVPSGG